MSCFNDGNHSQVDLDMYNESINESSTRNDSDYNQYIVDHIQYVCDGIVNPLVLCFGMVGNAASVAVLRRKRLRHSFDEVEQSATSGLVCLSLSDCAFCAIGLLGVLMPAHYPSLLQNNGASSSSTWAVLSMYYDNFRAPLLNIFLLTSTWLIIVISRARYMAIADPFTAKLSVSVRHAHWIEGGILLASLLLNVPQFLRFRIIHGPCYDGCYCYFRVLGLFSNHVLITCYHILWHVIGTLLPLLMLSYCNCRLLRQVYKSGRTGSHRYSTSKISVILVSIITLFLVLVCPSMILTFLSHVSSSPAHRHNIYSLRIATTITNAMQSLNFACNFVLYSCISKQFRQMLIQMITCRRKKKTCKKKTRQCKPVEHHQLMRVKVPPQR